jgi:hypothetical protein
MAKHLVAPQDHAVFIAPGDGVRLSVQIGSETVWLTAAQMAELFERDASVIRRHVRSVFRQGELAEENNRQNLPVIGAGRPEPTYSLDVIISVGYRVKSQRGVAFRQWATRTLREHLIHNYRRRAEESSQILAGLKNIELLAHGAATGAPRDTEEILTLIERYARSWHLLLQYDEKKLPPPSGEPSKRMTRLTPRQAAKVVQQFKS